MRKMTEEDKQKIAQQVELFRKEKMTFDSEVAKWDDAGNDIIFLAKHMCMIMMEMTDFTRYGDDDAFAIDFVIICFCVCFQWPWTAQDHHGCDQRS